VKLREVRELSEELERAMEDASFYGKLITILFTNGNCGETCSKISEALSSPQLSRRYIWLSLDSEENLALFLRLSRGIVPSVVLLNERGEIIGLLEGADPKALEEGLRRLIDLYYSGQVKANRIRDIYPEPQEFDEAGVLEAIGSILSSLKADFRQMQLILFYSKLEQVAKKVIAKLTPQDAYAQALLSGSSSLPSTHFTDELALKVKLTNEGVEEVLSRIGEQGEVRRSDRGKYYGYLIDQALTVDSLLSCFSKTGDQRLLDVALRVAEFTFKRLEHEKGFLDNPGFDRVSRRVFIEPLANAELAISLARLYIVTGEEKFAKGSLKAMSAAHGFSRSDRVIARNAIAYLKLNYGIKTRFPMDDLEDLRVQRVNGLECDWWFKGQCFKRLEEIEITAF